MTALLLHGLQAASTPPALCAPPHLRLPLGDLVALCTPTDPPALLSADAEADETALIEGALAHDRLLRACLSTGTLLPVRFGTVFSCMRVLQAAVARDASGYRRVLGRIGEASEYALRATLCSAAPCHDAKGERVRAPDGRTFLQARRERRDARQRTREDRLSWAEHLVERVAAIAQDVVPGRQEPGRLLSISLLVQNRCKAALESCVAEAAGDATRFGLQLTLTGPLPAYSFSDVTPPTAREAADA